MLRIIYYGFVVRFKQLRFFTIKNKSFLTISGYAVSKKEVKQIIEQDGYKCVWKDEQDIFSVEVVREKENVREHLYFLNTPIFSVLIFPKDVALRPQQSKIVLYLCNLNDCERRLAKVKEELVRISNANLNLHDFEDEVCSKANTMRRIMEFILKLEICFTQQGASKKIDDYSILLLGDLIKLIKDEKTDDEKTSLNRIVRLSNTLSHDSGLPIRMDDADELHEKIDEYLHAFTAKLKNFI